MTLRWIVCGGTGQLGTWLARTLREAPDHDLVSAPPRAELDVADRAAVEAALLGAPGGPPDVLVNAAAMTHVDRCELEPEEAERVNARAPELLADVCRKAGVRLAHVSTDYVLGGGGGGDRPWREDDAPQPRSAYGRSKLAGERAVLAASPDFLVVRTSWLFGPGRNFVAAILGRAAAGEPLRVVDDQVGSPTYARDLAEGIVALLAKGARGPYHLANAGAASWWDVARAALDAAGRRDVPVERIRSAELDRPAPRPGYSVLDCSKAARAGVALRGWREALAEYLRSPDSPLHMEGTGP